MRSAFVALAVLAGLSPAIARAQIVPIEPGISGWRLEVSGVHQPTPCAGDSIRVAIFGTLPSDCWTVDKIRVAPILCLLPCAPPIAVLLDDNACLRRLCNPTPVPFHGELRFGPLPAGEYTQVLQLFKVTCADTFPPTSSGAVALRFKVAPESLCTAGPRPCLQTLWADHVPGTICDATFDGGRAPMQMKLVTPVALKALEGTLSLYPDSSEITALAPIGPASGWTLVWNPTATGAHFVMFSPTGSTIPGPPPDRYDPPEVLGVTVAVRPGKSAPAMTRLQVPALTGADPGGNEIALCPFFPAVITGGAICAGEAGCDANGDGRVSVRDLVTMLLCLQNQCADSTRLDCEEDHDFDLADVICCARRMLRLPHGPAEPGRPAPGARVELGDPMRTADGWTVPLRLEGMPDLGAARLALDYPTDRYEVASVTRTDGPPGWMPLFDNDGGDLSIGLVNLGGPAFPGDHAVELAIELRPRSGAAAGGALSIASGEFSAADGAALDVSLPGRVVEIPQGFRLSASRPNPFASATRLTMSTDRAVSVRVTVHDLSGRRIATLFAGPLAPGSRSLSWEGTNDRGERVPDGVYFVRGAAAGATTSQKLVLLKSR